MPRFLQMEREHRSVIYAMWQASRKKPHEVKGASGARWSLFVTPREGMQTLIEVLTAHLVPETVRYGRVVESIRRNDKRWLVISQGGETLEADSVILAIPAIYAAQVVREFDSSLFACLGSISYSS